MKYIELTEINTGMVLVDPSRITLVRAYPEETGTLVGEPRPARTQIVLDGATPSW